MISKEAQALDNRRRLFGTSGIRGIVGQEITVDFCQEIARATGTSLALHSKVCVATDTRISREIVKDAVVSGLRASGIDVTELGILPTPALALLTREMGFDTGVMITASHNPPEYNGIKLFNGDCIGYSWEQEAEIERIYSKKAFRNGHTGSLDRNHEARERYFRFVLDRFPESSFKHTSRIVVDAGNGAASGFASELFSLAGLDALPINDKPDGLFPGRSPEPRKDTLEGTIEFTRQKNADLALCFDGDADRVVFCDKEGFLGLNEMIALISRFAVEKSQKRKVATTVETGRLLDLVLSELGVEIIRGRVGDASVSHITQQMDAAIGVEPIGVYILPEAGYYPDSLFATLTLLSQIKDTNEIRDSVNKMPQLSFSQRRLPCPDDLKVVVMERVEDNSRLLGAGRVNNLDGLRFEFNDSWILIRASGTEPIIRVIAEANSAPETEALLDKGVQVVEGILEGLKA
jgi:phosphoglucosamine mutase